MKNDESDFKTGHLLQTIEPGCDTEVLSSRKGKKLSYTKLAERERQRAIRLSGPVAKLKPGLADVIYVNF